MSNDVFISYAHADKEWLEKLQIALKPLLRKNPIAVWDDTKIRPGSKWRDEIQKALDDAELAVLLVSQNFLASDFITNEEVPHFLGAAHTKGLKIIWVPISDCLWTETDIANYQAVHDPNKPLDSLTASEVNRALVSICKEIKQALIPTQAENLNGTGDTPHTPSTPQHQQFHTPQMPPPPPPAQLGGTWRSMDGSYSIIRQNGTMLLAEAYVDVFGIATKTASGQGAVMGRQAYIDFVDMYGDTGRTEITLSDDGSTISGVARYSNGFVSNIFATRSF